MRAVEEHYDCVRRWRRAAPADQEYLSAATESRVNRTGKKSAKSQLSASFDLARGHIRA